MYNYVVWSLVKFMKSIVISEKTFLTRVAAPVLINWLFLVFLLVASFHTRWHDDHNLCFPLFPPVSNLAPQFDTVGFPQSDSVTQSSAARLLGPSFILLLCCTLTTHYSPLTTHYSLLTSPYSLLTACDYHYCRYN